MHETKIISTHSNPNLVDVAGVNLVKTNIAGMYYIGKRRDGTGYPELGVSFY